MSTQDKLIYTKIKFWKRQLINFSRLLDNMSTQDKLIYTKIKFWKRQLFNFSTFQDYLTQ